MRNGFTLIELSIVLVILGLLVGGIMAGQNIIRSSELRGVVADFTRISIAVNSFHDQYGQLPGDGDEMFDYFGTDCAATALDCNGNNDGLIGGAINGSVHGEGYMAIRQLALAGLVEGDYRGRVVGGSQAGDETIPSSISNAGFWIWHWGALDYFQTGGNTAGTRFNWIHLGGDATSGGTAWNNTRILLPKEAENIDEKMDDGMPGLGNMIGGSFTTNCSTTNEPTTARYDVARTSENCQLALKL